jgi:general secretion pathway protein K
MPRREEAGAALLTVLLLVAILSVITTLALQRITLANAMTRNIVSGDQQRAFLQAGEQIAALRIADAVSARPDKVTLAGNWLGTPLVLPVPGGVVQAQVADAGNCFNLNSLVQEPETGSTERRARPAAIVQFASLMRLLGVAPARAQQVANAAADWADGDSVPLPGGAEDEVYTRVAPAYRAANTLYAHPSELRMVAGITPDIYQRLRPWLCALPVADLSPININTLLPDQAVLLAMLAPEKISVDAARGVLAQRPADGYASLVAFWAQPALARLGVPGEVTQQTRQTSRWFEVKLSVDLGGDTLDEMALYDGAVRPARLLRRSWGESD